MCILNYSVECLTCRTFALTLLNLRPHWILSPALEAGLHRIPILSHRGIWNKLQLAQWLQARGGRSHAGATHCPLLGAVLAWLAPGISWQSRDAGERTHVTPHGPRTLSAPAISETSTVKMSELQDRCLPLQSALPPQLGVGAW